MQMLLTARCPMRGFQWCNLVAFTAYQKCVGILAEVSPIEDLKLSMYL